MLSCVRENWVSSPEPARLRHLQVTPPTLTPLLPSLRLGGGGWGGGCWGGGVGLCGNGCGRMLSQKAVSLFFMSVSYGNKRSALAFGIEVVQLGS